MDNHYRAAGLVHGKQQFKPNTEMGILSAPNTTTYTESIESIEQFTHQNMDYQEDRRYDATLLANNFNVGNLRASRFLM